MLCIIAKVAPGYLPRRLPWWSLYDAIFCTLRQECSLLPSGSNQLERQVLSIPHHCLLPRQSASRDPDHHRPILSIPSSGWDPHSGESSVCDVTASATSVPARSDLKCPFWMQAVAVLQAWCKSHVWPSVRVFCKIINATCLIAWEIWQIRSSSICYKSEEQS